MKLNMSKINLFLDLALALVFIVEMEEHFTGLANHELLGLVFGVMFLIHILFHWKWIVTITTQFLRKLIHESRVNYLLNLVLLVDMVVVSVTGIVISRTLGLNLGLERESSMNWQRIHIQASQISLILVGVHVGMHWKWIISHTRKYLLNPGGRLRSLTHSTKKYPVQAS